MDMDNATTVDITKLPLYKLNLILDETQRQNKPDHCLIRRIKREIDRKTVHTWY